MPAQLATLIVAIFILYLFWEEIREDQGTSHALWIPMIWMFLAGSRYASQWLDLGQPVDPRQVYRDGSPLDGAIFGLLIAAGAAILVMRRLDWGRLILNNKWIGLYFLFCAASVVWADESFVSLKRWVKAMGDVTMALVVLSEEKPIEAIGTLLRRLAFVVLPLSVLFIKFYPDLGRAYHMGFPMYTGVATTKNSLGQVCVITGIYFGWSLAYRWQDEYEKGGGARIFADLIFLAMIGWLLYMANSATSWVCVILLSAIFAAGRIKSLADEPQRLVNLFGMSIVLFFVLEQVFGVSDWIIASLGRDKDLTTRVPMWELLLGLDTNPFVGAGYESFWSGERMEKIWRQFPGIIQAHNGYLDLYLNVGMIGLLLMLVSIIAGLVRIVDRLETAYSPSILLLAFCIAVVMNNWAEATIKPVSNMFVILLFGIVNIPDDESLVDDETGGRHGL
jgi:exopolysaccharide production protein ExoQ